MANSNEKKLFEFIPRDVLEIICNTLPIKYQFRFARVCKSAHSLVYERRNPKTLGDTPWLIGLTDNSSSLCETIYDGQVTCYQVGTRPFKYSEPNIVGYSKGWFYVHYLLNGFIQLVNLFIDVQVDLPPLSNMVLPEFKCGYLFAHAFALSLCKSMRPLMIAIVDQYGDLALCKTNGGSTWKSHEHDRRDEGHYITVTFFHEKLYAMRIMFSRKIDIFKVGDDDLRLFPVGVIDYKDVFNLSLLHLIEQTYLVEDSKGDNMFIVMQYQMFGEVFEFEVFKVERDGDEFVRMNDLGDQIMLLGDSCSDIIDVKDCSTSDVFKGNQICFKDGLFHDVGIYSLKDGTTIWEYPKKGLQCLQWIFPRFITSAECNCEAH